MTDDIEARLTELAGLVQESWYLRRRRSELDGRLAEQTAESESRRAGHAAELHDVERLESLSLSRVLVALRGSHAADLSRERAEADAARYRVAEAESRLAALAAERRAVDARLHALADLPARWVAAVDDKDRYVRASGGPQAARLTALAEERGRAEAELRELTEAAGAADVALGALGEVRRQLDHASRLKANDRLLGGALLLGKPDWLDGVARAAAHADRCVAVLHTELTDVGLARSFGTAQSAVRPTGVSSGFLESVFSDMMLRERIVQAQRNVDHSAYLVAEVRREITERTTAVRARRDTVMRERQSVLAP